MRVFISSVIGGFEEFREVAAEAIEALGHEVIRAEDFAASPSSPQVACLDGVRSADVVLVILGARYGSPQSSGKSPTHEEFDEATRTKPVFVFIESDIEPETAQAGFISEARAWGSGHFTSKFAGANDLRKQITRALHRWEVAGAAGQVDAQEIADRVLAALPEENRYRSSGRSSVAISIVGAPHQTILRPSEIEDPKLQKSLQQQALFGNPSIFDPSEGTSVSIEGHSLKLRQEHGRMVLSADGALLLVLPLPETEGISDVIIEEDVIERLIEALQFSAQVLQGIDSTERLSSIAIAAAILNPPNGEWRTRAKHERRPNSMQMTRMYDESPVRAVLSPAHLSRAAFRQQVEAIAQDLTVLLRRFYQKDDRRRR